LLTLVLLIARPHSEEEYWYFEVFVILEKMVLTGGMCLVADGSTVQTVVAFLVSFVYMMFVLRTAPFLHDNDDVLSFVTSLQLVLTFLGALILQMDQAIATARTTAAPNSETMDTTNSMEQFDPMTIGYCLIAINVLCLILMVFSLMAAFGPLVKEYCCKKKSNTTKVNPGGGGGGGDEAEGGNEAESGANTTTGSGAIERKEATDVIGNDDGLEDEDADNKMKIENRNVKNWA
jgi:hypothetical protein